MAQSNADKYRAYAEECMQLIKRMPSDTRPTLLRIGEAWLELARAEMQQQPPSGQPAPGVAPEPPAVSQGYSALIPISLISRP